MNDTPQTTRAPRLESVQVLRFVAAFLVMGAHSKLVLRDEEIPSSWDASLAACGVDVFFVISGFVIAMTAGRARSAKTFMMDRVLRVLPLYFLVSALFAAKRVLSGEGLTGSAWVNSVLFVPLLDTGEYTSTFHPYGWSIAYEMWFYALVGIFLRFVAKTRASLLCASVLAAGTLVVGLGYDARWLAPRFLFSPLVLEFAAGCALFTYRDRIRAYRGYAWAALPVFLATIPFTSYLGYPGEVIGNTSMGFARALIWGGFSVCVFSLFYAAEDKVKWPRSLVALGTASYSIYLIQPFVVRAVKGLEMAASMRLACFFGISIVLGWLMYLCVERPLLVFAKSWQGRRSAPEFPVKAEVLQRSPA